MIHVPRLPKGKGYIGPDHYGCCNTGLAPAIFHGSYKWVVGPEIPCREAFRAASAMLGNAHTWTDPHGRKVWLFKTRGPAVKKFMELCGAIIMENYKTGMEVQELRKRAQAGDLSAAHKLMDY